MDHIRQHDWCPTNINLSHFVEEQDIDNCVVERIIRNRFWDPNISSDEDEKAGAGVDWDWDIIFKKKSNKQQKFRHFVPGFRKAPPYPKISALTQTEHLQAIKVLCAQNDHILPKVFLGRPVKNDYRVLEEKKAIYEAEQQEYIEWAKHLWQTSNCVRALRPKPLVELVYDAEFKMKAHRVQCLPKAYTMAAQIPLKADNHTCEMILPKSDLIKVDLSKLAKVCYPQIYETKESILRECPLPKPCQQHPVGFQLPNESEPSILPMTELHKELSQFALDNKSEFIASENAIKCLLETDRSWTLPVSVCEVLGPDGDKINIVVLDNEFPDKRDPAMMRSYKAFKHLLLNAFVDQSSRPKSSDANDSNRHTKPNGTMDKKLRSYKSVNGSNRAAVKFNSAVRKLADYNDDSDSDEDNRLEIDLDDGATTDSQNASEIEDNHNSSPSKTTIGNTSVISESPPRKILRARLCKNSDNKNNEKSSQMDCQEQKDSDKELITDMDLTDSDNKTDKQVTTKTNGLGSSKTNGQESSEMDAKELNTSKNSEHSDKDSILECSCKGTEYERPYPRSYKKVQIRNHNTNDQVNVIIHSSHKLRRDWTLGEVILEPILEYQLEVGATLQSPHKLQSLAFSLMLRKNAELTLVRVDGSCGELVSIECMDLRELTVRHAHCSASAIANVVYTTLNQLAGLLPGHYLLRHEPSHGSNALLYTCASPGAGAEGAVPLLSGEPLSASEEARQVSPAPKLAPVLLPLHKYRRQLPLAFTTNPKCVAKENPHKCIQKAKHPPAAIQWPKKRGRKKKAKE